MSLDEIPGKRKLKVDMDGLEMAFDNSSYELNYYLDVQTGEVVLVTEETRRAWEDIYAELPEEAQTEGGFEAAVSQGDLPDGEKEELLRADMVESGYGDRYIEIPRADLREGYTDMESFIETVGNRGLRDRLEHAIAVKRPFRRFKDALLSYPAEEERWFRFRDERVRERVLEWLDEEGIEPELGK